MARVRATVKCFIDNSIREEGAEFEYNGPMIDILEPVDVDVVLEPPERKKPGRPARKSVGADDSIS